MVANTKPKKRRKQRKTQRELELDASWLIKDRRKALRAVTELKSGKNRPRPPDPNPMTAREAAMAIRGYDPWADKGDTVWKPRRAAAAIKWIHDHCTHVKGGLGRTPKRGPLPFYMAPHQRGIVANLFGWYRPDGTRRYRRCFYKVPRKNGKTTFAAALLNYVAMMDGEPGAEIYSAAAEREQARLVMQQVKGMIRQDVDESGDDLSSNARCLQHAIVYRSDVSYKALSSEAGSKYGFNAHLVIFDELHVQPNRELVDVMETSMASRDQPLMVYITTSDFQRESICNEIDDYAHQVRDGIISDRSFLPVIYEADTNPHRESFQSFAALAQLDKMCSCKCVPPILIDKVSRGVCARHAIAVGGNRTARTTESGVRGTRKEESVREGNVRRATNSGASTQSPNTRQELSELGGNGPYAIQQGSKRYNAGGDQNQKTSSTRLTGTAKESTVLARPNMPECADGKTANVPSVACRPKSCASIIVTMEAAFGASSVPNATLESAFSEILKTIYKKHSPTCKSREAAISGCELAVGVPGDDWTCESTWRKANPNFGVSVQADYIRQECLRAQASPAYENTFKRLHLNIRTEQDVRWLQMERWDACGTDFDVEELKGRECWAGLDLATTADLTAFVLVFPDGDRFKVLPFFWLPETQKTRRDKSNREIYRNWIAAGLIRVTPGDVTDYSFVRRDINELAQDYGIREVAIDRVFQGAQLSTDLASDGFEVIAFGQGFLSMAAPTAEFERLVIAGRLDHGHHPILRWMAANVSVEIDAAGNMKASKKKSADKIDGIISTIMALGQILVSDKSGSVYEDRGILML